MSSRVPPVRYVISIDICHADITGRSFHGKKSSDIYFSLFLSRWYPRGISKSQSVIGFTAGFGECVGLCVCVCVCVRVCVGGYLFCFLTVPPDKQGL